MGAHKAPIPKDTKGENMKRKLGLLLAMTLLCSQSAFASVGFKDGGGSPDQVADLDCYPASACSQSGGVGTIDNRIAGITSGTVSGISSFSTTGDVVYRTNLYANGRYGAASTVLFSSSTTLQQAGIPYALILKAIGNNPTAEVTTLPAGTTGQEVAIRIYAAGPAGSWKIQPDTAATTPVKSVGFTSLTFNAVGQSAVIGYLNDTLGWYVKNTGTSASSASPTMAAPSLN